MRQATCGECGIWHPCWPIPDNASACVDCLNISLDEEGVPVNPDDVALFEAAWAEASSYVYDRTCQRWSGSCFYELVRPCMNPCGHVGDCRCGTWQALDLSGAFCLPVDEILKVVVDGEVWSQPWRTESVSFSAPCAPGAVCGPYLVLEEDCPHWPQQRLQKRLGDDCTWAILAKVGCDPPPHVLAQTLQLALQIVKQCQGAEDCALPDNVASMSRKGMTVTFDKGIEKTGLPLLDSILDKWKCEPADFERFVDPSAGDEVRFHRVWNKPVREEDLAAALTEVGLDPAICPA